MREREHKKYTESVCERKIKNREREGLRKRTCEPKGTFSLFVWKRNRERERERERERDERKTACVCREKRRETKAKCKVLVVQLFLQNYAQPHHRIYVLPHINLYLSMRDAWSYHNLI